MERNEQDYRRNSDNWRNRDSSTRRELTDYQNRHSDYGMHNRDTDYRHDRSSEGSWYGRNPSGYGAGSGTGSQRGNSDDRSSWQRNSPQSNQSRSDRETSYDRNNTYGTGSRYNTGSSDHYRYGDPNPYMQNMRNGGYERTRGTGWRSESDTYEGTSYSPNRYERQDNSYVSGGEGRRYSSFGRDEEENYGHNMRDSLDHRHVDRGEHDRSRWENDYSPQRQYGSTDSNRNSNRSREWHNVSDKYSQHRDQHLFDHTDNNYPSSSRYADRHRSGPDWSADSAASDYSQSDLRG